MESAIERSGAKILDKVEASFGFDVKEKDRVALCCVTWSSSVHPVASGGSRKATASSLYLPSKFIAVTRVLPTALVQGQVGV